LGWRLPWEAKWDFENQEELAIVLEQAGNVTVAHTGEHPLKALGRSHVCSIASMRARLTMLRVIEKGIESLQW